MAACLTAEKHGEDFIEDIYFPQVVFFLNYLQEILVITERVEDLMLQSQIFM